MSHIDPSNPDRMVFRSGGGCLALFGLPFFFAGLFVMLSPLLGTMKDKEGEPAPVYFAVPFGLVFAAVGAGLVFGRAGKVIDRRERSVTTWWGLLGWRRTKRHALDGFNAVLISREVRRSKNSTYTVYPVRLSGHGTKVSLGEPRDENDARKLGEEAAKFVGLKLVDRSGGEAVVREAGTLDESLRERAQREGREVPLPPRPADSRITFRAQGSTLRLELPPPGFRAPHYVMMGMGLLFPLIAGGVLAGVFLTGKGPPDAMKWVMAAFLGVFFIALPLALILGGAVRSATKRATIEVSPDALRLVEKGVLLDRAREIPADEVEELRLGEGRSSVRVNERALSLGRVITARSDRLTLAFGEGLSDEELAWLKAVVEKTLTV